MKQYALRHFSQRFDLSEYINVCRVYHLSR